MRPVTQSYLENAAAYYLSRYASSAQNLKVVLERKVRKRNPAMSPLSSEQSDWINAVVEKFTTTGILDDAGYARNRTFALHRSGKSEKAISGYLRQKGIDESLIRDALEELKEELGEGRHFEAGLTYARKRRFGPWRTRENTETVRRKELASFARAGFGYDIARRIIDAEDIDTPDD